MDFSYNIAKSPICPIFKFVFQTLKNFIYLVRFSHITQTRHFLQNDYTILSPQNIYSCLLALHLLVFSS